MAHTCHLPGCEAACPPKHLYCRPHWRMVPAEFKAEVYRTVKLRGDHVDETWAPWWRAQARAEAAVLRKAHPEHEEWIAKRLAHAEEFAASLEERAKERGESPPSQAELPLGVVVEPTDDPGRRRDGSC